jgi:alpha-tubulin suppressor-like RCC1 family protein
VCRLKPRCVVFAVAWGDFNGGDASSVDLTSVVSISCGGAACVALKEDGTAEAWGSSNNGGDASSVDLTSVVSISCGGAACVALKDDSRCGVCTRMFLL